MKHIQIPLLFLIEKDRVASMIEEKMVEKFLHMLTSKYPNFEKHFPIIQKACDLAIQAHKGQKRKYSGGPFIEHPLNVALI